MYSVYLFHIPPFFKQQKSHFCGFHHSTNLLFIYFFSTFFLLSLNKKSQFPAYYHKNILPLFLFFFFSFFLFLIFLFFLFVFFFFLIRPIYYIHRSFYVCVLFLHHRLVVWRLSRVVFFVLFCPLRRILCSRSTIRLRFSHISSLTAIRPLAFF